MKHLKRISLLAVFVIFAVLLSAAVNAEQAEIQSAISAGPMSLTKNATIMRWNGDVLRKGTNGWTCLQTFQATEETTHGASTRRGRISLMR
jgi:hypothetical protein